jgi:glycosyltransferase involved in cell wall biosynthesis
MAELTVGVAIPVYNAESFLAGCLDSVLAQTLPVDEVVVVDDGSTDASARVAAGYGSRVRLLSTPRAATGAARNRAIGQLSSELILSFDADDLLLPGAVADLVAGLTADPARGIAFGHERRFREIRDGGPVPVGELLPAPRPGAMLMWRWAHERIGPFGQLRSDGLDLMLRLREAGVREVTVPAQVVWRRVHGANATLVDSAPMSEYPRAIKASLDRRRAQLATREAAEA